MKVVISNFISVKISTLLVHPKGQLILESLKKKFTYKNPDFVEAKKWGRYTGNLDEYIHTYHVLGDEIKINRGGLNKVQQVFKAVGITPEWVDYTHVCAPVKIIKKAKFELREDQKDLLKSLHEAFKIMPVPQGIVKAQTSFGKTFSMICFAEEIGQPLLILVHTTFMQKQWIEELTLNFGVDKKDIGGAGGVFSKPKVCKINVALYHSMCKKEINILFRDAVGFLLVDEGQKAAIKQFQEAIKPFRARYRITCTANHERKDGKTFVITDTIGEVLYEAKEVESNSKIFSKIFATKSKWNPTNDIDWDTDIITYDEAGREIRKKPHDGYTTYISEASRNHDRNVLIARCGVRKAKEGKIVIIFVERKEQAAQLAKLLSKWRVHLLIGMVSPKEMDKMDLPEKARQFLTDNKPDKALEEVKALALYRDLDFIIATQKGEVGLSIETLDHAIVTTPVGNNLERFNQLKGRVERQHKDERINLYGQKSTPTVEIIVDDWDTSYNSWAMIKNEYTKHIIRNPYIVKKG